MMMMIRMGKTEEASEAAGFGTKYFKAAREGDGVDWLQLLNDLGMNEMIEVHAIYSVRCFTTLCFHHYL